MTMNIAALASGKGSNIAALVRHIAGGRVDARINLVLSNNPTAPVVEFARNSGIAVWAKSHKDFSSREAFDRAMLEAIAETGAEVVVLAGYMRILSPVFIQAFAGRILNIHPALLPAFPGAHGVRDALAQGVKVTGCTVHIVDELLDHGPTIIQAVVPIQEGDTENDLQPRIQAMEHRILSQAIQWFAEQRLVVEENRVRLLPRERAGAVCCVSLDNAKDCGGGHGESSLGPWLVSPALEGI